MIGAFLQKEEELKASAQKAAQAGDWAALRRDADELVRVYGAILVSGMVADDSLPRWRRLRERWAGIASSAEEKAAVAAAGQPAKRVVLPPVDVSDAPAPADRDGKNAEGIKPSGETLRLDDVKGLAEAKQVVMDALVNPAAHPDIYEKLKIKGGRGLLLYGPPGTGKTMFARAIAGEMKLPFIYKKISELKDKYVGESEKGVSRLFAEAWAYKKAVVFLDECEGLLRRRGNQKVNVVEAFIAEFDGFATDREARIFVLLATNRPWLIDSAVMRSGRIGTAVYVGLPDEETRRAIIAAALKDVPVAPDVNVDEIVSLTEGYSGAELHHGEGGGVCNLAEVIAGRRWIARRARLKPDDPEWARIEYVTRRDFLDAVKAVVPVSRKDPEIVKKNLAFTFGGMAPAADADGECE